MDKRQKNNLMTLLTLIVVLGQFILWIMLLLLDNVDDFAAITNMYDYIRMQNITIKIDTILFTVIVISYLNRINNTIQI